MMENKILGKGNTAEVIEYGIGKVCKLFNEGYPREYAELEFQNAKVMKKEGISVPEVYELVENGNRIGIIYERIYGQSLMDVFFQGQNVEYVFDLFISLQREILKHHSKELVSYKNFLIESLKGKSVKNDSLVEKICSLSEGECICHGDFHPGNIILKPDQTAVVIDFMNVCRGKWEYEVARTYVLLSECEEHMKEEMKGVSIGEIYLKNMGVEIEDIKEYVEVVKEYRRIE